MNLIFRKAAAHLAGKKSADQLPPVSDHRGGAAPPITGTPHQHRKISLVWMLTLPFILQVGAVAGLVGYLSDRNSQQAIEQLTNQLMDSTHQRVEQKLTSYLATPKLANQLISDAVGRGDLSLDLSQPNAQRDRYLWQTMQQFSNLTWISLGSQQGDSTGVWRPADRQDLQLSMSNRSTKYFGNYFATNAQGQRTVRLKVEKPAYDPRIRPWYKEAATAKTPIWNQVYAGFTPGTFFIAASAPLYDRSGQLIGVSGIDILLSNIQQFLSQNPVTPTGQVFLMERQTGLLVSSSTAEAPFRTAPGQQPERVAVLNSETPLMRSTAAFLRQRFGQFSAITVPQKLNFAIDYKPQFVEVVPFSQPGGLDWLIVIVVPEADVMAKIHAGSQTTVWLCIGSVLITIGFNTWLSRRLVRPIQHLSQASAHITQGDFSHPVTDSSIQELSTLTGSFNQMSHEIQQSRQQLQDYSNSLEKTVNDRTAALQQEVRHRTAAEAALQVANQKLRRMAYLDGLTQIANRRLFDERLQYEWQRLQREQQPLSLILGDVDFFKLYNDTYGHQVGDDCLCFVARAMAEATRRPADLAARYGGEEFVVLLPNTNVEGAMEVAKSIQANLAQLKIPHQSSQVNPYVTASLGVASTIPAPTIAADSLLLNADRALYQAKLAGRNCIFSNG
jgi:diguanylate cyclase (GGDEF)-like protein